MRVAFVLGTSTGGTGRHVKMLAAGCAARGAQVQVFGPAQTDRDFGFSGGTADTPVRFSEADIADRPRLLRDLQAILRLRRLLGAAAADVVHAHGLRAGALTAIALVFGRPRQAPPSGAPPSGAPPCGAPPALIVTVHNAPLAGGVTGAVYRVLELIVARRADTVLCVSADLEERMRAAGARRVGHAVVPAPLAPLAPQAGGVSAETRAAIRAELGAGQDATAGRPLVLAVGRLAAQKGFDVLLDAAALWRDIRPEPLLVIVGEGPLQSELEDRAASLGVAVTFAGHRPDVPVLLVAADVFVLPSAWEGQSLVLQEALRAAVPIVATRVGGNPELAGQDAALLVPSGDAQCLADGVRAVLADPALAARLRKAAADYARALPDEDHAVASALAEYARSR
jgi:glycosyltransferase involved in cell wall biosynthesis